MFVTVIRPSTARVSHVFLKATFTQWASYCFASMTFRYFSASKENVVSFILVLLLQYLPKCLQIVFNVFRTRNCDSSRVCRIVESLWRATLKGKESWKLPSYLLGMPDVENYIKYLDFTYHSAPRSNTLGKIISIYHSGFNF